MAKRMKFAVLIAVVALAVAVSSAPAMADNLTVSLSNGGIPTTCADGAACDSNALPGAVTFSTTYGSVTVSLGGTGSGSPALTGTNLDLSYNLTAASGSAGGTFTIAVSENDLSGTFNFGAADNGNQNSGVTTALNIYADGSNTLFGQGTTICSAGSTSASVVNLACSGGPFTGANFSLTDSVTLTAPAGSLNASGDAKLTPLPEPGTLAMLSSGLLALVGFRRRKI